MDTPGRGRVRFGSAYRAGRDEQYQADRAARCNEFLMRLVDSYVRQWRQEQQRGYDVWQGLLWTREQLARRNERNQQLEQRVSELETDKAWLEQQYGNWTRTAQEQAGHIEQLTQQISKLEEGKAWLEEQCGNWMRASQERDSQVEQLKQWNSKLEEGKAWLEQQCDNWMRASQERDSQIEQLKQWINELEKGKA